jgi:hypothetical protein
VYYILEDDFRVLLVNPADIKRMPGRKTDVSDSAWLAQLLENGMLQPSFIPPREVRELRDLVRYRSSLKHDHTRIANRLHKVLQDADLKLSSVMTDILGVSGRQILAKLAKGDTDPAALADLARGSLRQKLPALRQALAGRFNAHAGGVRQRRRARTRNTALAALYRRMIVRGGRKFAAFVVGRHILNVAYHLLRQRTSYREVGATHFEQRRREQLKRRCLDQLRNLGFQAALTPLPKAA